MDQRDPSAGPAISVPSEMRSIAWQPTTLAFTVSASSMRKVPPPVGLPLTNSPLKHEPSGKIHSPELIAPSFQLPASSLGPVYLPVPALASDFHSPV